MTTSGVLRLGTRGSALALWQAEHVAARLRAGSAVLRVELDVLSSRGDADRVTPLPEIGGKGVFTEHLEHALRDGRIDLAVHSLKDLPVEPAKGLVLGAILGRDDPRDVLVSRDGATLAALPRGAVVGTSSTRRAAQLLAVRPDLEPRPIRGNVETRLEKVRNGTYDAAVLAAAGIARLGLAERITEFLPLDTFLPAPGQAALAVQCRAEDERVRALLETIDEPGLRAATEAERAFLEWLGGGCAVPVAALATPDGGDGLVLDGWVGAPDGSRTIRRRGRGEATHAAALGIRLAEQALREGAAELLG
ncbi:MAG: hydroxymethylbilane synthase [Gemmatimonadota bacterium]|jgi:hydroxymethylbilane synthase